MSFLDGWQILAPKDGSENCGNAWKHLQPPTSRQEKNTVNDLEQVPHRGG
jgi:hypothetical protein